MHLHIVAVDAALWHCGIEDRVMRTRSTDARMKSMRGCAPNEGERRPMQVRGKDAINKLTGVTPAMFAPEIRAQMSLPARVVINDITLREGRQAEGTIL